MKTTKQEHKNDHVEYKEEGFEYPQWKMLDNLRENYANNVKFECYRKNVE